MIDIIKEKEKMRKEYKVLKKTRSGFYGKKRMFYKISRLDLIGLSLISLKEIIYIPEVLLKNDLQNQIGTSSFKLLVTSCIKRKDNPYQKWSYRMCLTPILYYLA